MHGAVAYLYRWPAGLCSRCFAHRERRARRSGQDRLALCDDGLEKLDGRFLRCAADVAGADVVIVGKDAGDVTVDIDALDPVLLSRARTGKGELLLRGKPSTLFARELRRRCRRRLGGCFAEVGVDIAAIAARIQSCNHAASVRAYPHCRR